MDWPVYVQTADCFRVAAAQVCKRCQQTKSSSEFYRNKLMSDGLYSHCKVRRPAGRLPVVMSLLKKSLGAQL